MALIDARGQVIADDWVYPKPEQSPCSPKIIHGLDILLNTAAPVRPFRLFLSPDAKIEPVIQHLDKLDLLAIEFPTFRDGRGFTIARRLREQHAFRGDIRAVGHVLPDQFAALIQCGFTSILTPPDHPPVQWQNLITPPSAGAMRSAPLLRRLLSP
jgi:uncharacterized protein (DUF934 family)